MSTTATGGIKSISYHSMDTTGTALDYGVGGQDSGYGKRPMPFSVLEKIVVDRDGQHSERVRHVASAYTMAMADDLARGLNAISGW